MANIEKRNGTYRVKVRLKGHPTKNATFHTRTEAKRWAQSIEASLREGRPEENRHTLAELIDKYLLDVLPHKSRSSIYMQTQQLTYWQIHLGHYTLEAITPGMIAEHRDILARTRKSSTVRRYLAALSHTFTIAIKEYQWANENPCQKIRKPPEPKGRVRFLSEDETKRLLETCKTSRNPYLYIVVVIALATGARKMEILSLQWSDADLTRGVLTFRHTKNGETRSVPLTGYALELLKQHDRRPNSPLVFPDATGKKPLSVRDAFVNTVKQAGIEDFRFHDLRHSAASYLAMNGASLLEIAEVLGHKTLSMVKRYSHLSEGHTRSVVERMNQSIFSEKKF